MTLFERLFYGLERIDVGVARVTQAVTSRREKHAASQAAVDEAMARQASRASRDATPATVKKPLGDPSIAIQLYGRRADPWTGRALLIVRDQDLPHAFVELEDDDGRLQARLQTETQQDVLPYVYVRGEFIGGYNALDELNRLGILEDAVQTPEERARSGKPVLIVPKRGPERAPPGERS
jgi:glutaredoxin-related protein